MHVLRGIIPGILGLLLGDVSRERGYEYAGGGLGEGGEGGEEDKGQQDTGVFHTGFDLT